MISKHSLANSALSLLLLLTLSSLCCITQNDRINNNDTSNMANIQESQLEPVNDPDSLIAYMATVIGHAIECYVYIESPEPGCINANDLLYLHFDEELLDVNIKFSEESVTCVILDKKRNFKYVIERTRYYIDTIYDSLRSEYPGRDFTGVSYEEWLQVYRLDYAYLQYIRYLSRLSSGNDPPYLTLQEILYGMEKFWHFRVTNNSLSNLKLLYRCEACYVTIEFYVGDSLLSKISEEIPNCDLGGLHDSGEIEITY